MEMPKTILCTIDFSDSSKHALQWAIVISRELKTHLTVLYTYRLRVIQKEEVVQMRKKLENDAIKIFSAWEKELLKGRGISYDFKTEVGFISDRIEEHTKHNPVSFLVMGKNNSASNKESFDDLVKHIDIPLVIVP
jgi:nucleotide-binding universal stress UspA family protein